MSTNETAKAPSIFKAALLFAATAALVAVSSRAPAETPSAKPHAYAGTVKVRIRGVGPMGLSPVAFADWIAEHRDIRGDRSTALFAHADADHNRYVSPIELKDLLLSLGTA